MNVATPDQIEELAEFLFETIDALHLEKDREADGRGQLDHMKPELWKDWKNGSDGKVYREVAKLVIERFEREESKKLPRLEDTVEGDGSISCAYIVVREHEKVYATKRHGNVVVDYDEDGNVLGVELLDMITG